MAAHGPQTAEHVGASKGPSGSAGRRVPSDARMAIKRMPLSLVSLSPFSPIAPRAPRSPSKMQRSSVPCSHTSLQSPKSPHFCTRTRTFGSYIYLSIPIHYYPTYDYRPLRLPRATATQESSRLNQKIFHLPDGPDQRTRDEAMRAAMGAELEGKPIPDGNPNQWADRTKSRVQFDYDAYAEVERWWASGGGRQLLEALGGVRGGHKSSSSSVKMMVKSRL